MNSRPGVDHVMRNEDLLRQASSDAQRVRELPSPTREFLNRETDWNGSRMRGYEARPEPHPNPRS